MVFFWNLSFMLHFFLPNLDAIQCYMFKNIFWTHNCWYLSTTRHQWVAIHFDFVFWNNHWERDHNMIRLRDQFSIYLHESTLRLFCTFAPLSYNASERCDGGGGGDGGGGHGSDVCDIGRSIIYTKTYIHMMPKSHQSVSWNVFRILLFHWYVSWMSV